MFIRSYSDRHTQKVFSFVVFCDDEHSEMNIAPVLQVLVSSFTVRSSYLSSFLTIRLLMTSVEDPNRTFLSWHVALVLDVILDSARLSASIQTSFTVWEASSFYCFCVALEDVAEGNSGQTGIVFEDVNSPTRPYEKEWVYLAYCGCPRTLRCRNGNRWGTGSD